MFRSASLFIGTSFTEAVFTIFATSNVDSIGGIPHKIYSKQRNFNPHEKPISLLNVPICTQGMQRTWWPEAGTIIVTGPYSWWRHQRETFSALLAVCEGNPLVSGGSPHKGQWRGDLMFSLIFPWTNDWATNRDADDLRLHPAHYDVTVMCYPTTRRGHRLTYSAVTTRSFPQ